MRQNTEVIVNPKRPCSRVGTSCNLSAVEPSFFLMRALLLLSITTLALGAQPFFVYDAADQTVVADKAQNSLCYDGSIAVTGNKTLVTWLEFQPGQGDVIWFGTRDASGQWVNKQKITPAAGDYSNPTLSVDAQSNIWLTYESATNETWHVFARKSSGDGGFSQPMQVSANTGANIHHHVAASPKKGIWITWQADDKGQLDIFTRCMGAEDGTTAMRVSESPLGDWHPSVAVTRDNQVIVAWDSYDGTSYNIRARAFVGNSWGEILRVTDSTNFNANAHIISDKTGRIWMAWEEDGPNWGKAYRPRTDAKKESHHMSDDVGSLHRFRKLHLGELAIDRHELRLHEVPQPSFAAAMARTDAPSGVKQLGVFYQSPVLAVDGADRLWLVYRHFYMPSMGITHKTHVQDDWGIYARCLDHDTWSKLYRFDEGQGDALQRISVASQTNGISIAWTFGRTDRRNPQNWMEDKLAPEKVVPYVSKKGEASGEDEEGDGKAVKGKKKKANKDVAAPSVEVDTKPLRGIALASIVAEHQTSTNTAKVETVSIRQGEGKQRINPKPPRPAFNFNGKHYELYYGDFHRHTDISLCFWPGDGTMDDAYRYGIDAAPLDFLGVTDHTHDIAMGDPLSLLWQRIRKEVNRHALANSFVPFYSYERSRGETDHNVISLRDDMLRPHTYPHSEFWKELDTNTFTIPHQPFNSVLWQTNDRIHRPLMEIYQGFRNHTCEKDAKEGLDSGNEVGFIASSDHLSTGASYACVWAEQPNRESIFRALQARRTFAATDKIMLRVTCGDHWMGEKFTVKELPPIEVNVIGTDVFKKTEVFIDGNSSEIFPPQTGDRKHIQLWYSDIDNNNKLSGRHSIFFRFTQVDGNMAWSSPMWITIEK